MVQKVPSRQLLFATPAQLWTGKHARVARSISRSPMSKRIIRCTAVKGLNGTGPLYAALVGAQLIPFVFPHSGIPGDVAYFSITAVAALIIGCKRAKDELTDLAQPMSKKTAIAAPFIASAVLFGSYVLLKYTKIDIGLLFNGLTTFSGCLCLKEALDPLTGYFLAILGLQSSHSEAESSSESETKPIARSFTGSQILSTAIALSVVAGYLLKAPVSFVFSNAIAVGICARVLSLLRADSFLVAAGLLVGLFCYDIFWVFGSDVMVTVATQIDSPGKLLFPRDVTSGYPYAVLGLGDVCVPGIFVNLASAVEDVTGGPYFSAAVFAYLAGLLGCFGANAITQTAQPALLYLVPALIGSMLLTATVRRELPVVLQFRVKNMDD